MENIVNKNTELISIIIPVYNTEIYLDKCLKSVINQLPHSKLWGLNEVFDLVLFWCCF